MSGNRGESWAAAIPEFFYDLIARILPGAVFVMSAAVVLLPNGTARKRCERRSTYSCCERVQLVPRPQAVVSWGLSEVRAAIRSRSYAARAACMSGGAMQYNTS